jgi:hypothetical protein
MVDEVCRHATHVGRERNVVCVSRVSALPFGGETLQLQIHPRADKIRNYWRRWCTLWKASFITTKLRENRGTGCGTLKWLCHETSADPTEMN